MNFTQDEIAAIIGAKELECIALRRELAKVSDEFAKLKEEMNGLRSQING